jgi:hypothetical protein
MKGIACFITYFMITLEREMGRIFDVIVTLLYTSIHILQAVFIHYVGYLDNGWSNLCLYHAMSMQ